MAAFPVTYRSLSRGRVQLRSLSRGRVQLRYQCEPGCDEWEGEGGSPLMDTTFAAVNAQGP